MTKTILLILFSVLSFLFLLSGVKAAGTHPKIFFNSSEILDIQTKASGSHSAIWNSISSYANTIKNSSPPAYPSSPSHDAFVNPSYDLLILSFAYVVSNDMAYFDTARNWLIAFAGWPTWGDANSFDGKDLPFHHMLLSNAIAFDWLYNNLTEQDRITIRNTLITRARESYEAASMSGYCCSGSNWWKNSFAQNHFSTNISSLGIASMVLEEEISEATTWKNHAINEIKKDASNLTAINDGTWHEGLHYQNYKFQMSLPFYYNLKKLNIENIIPDTYFQNYAYWRIYNYLPNTGRPAMTYGDNDPDWGWNTYSPHVILRFVASQYNNGYAEWMAQQILTQYPRISSRERVIWYIFEFFYYDSSVSAVSPVNLSTDRLFDDLGIVISRTGWGNNDFIFAIKSSAYGGKAMANRYINSLYPWTSASYEGHAGHDHPDGNTWYFYKGGADLSSEKPHYQLVLGTAFHNTILVDNNEQYHANWPKKFYPDTDGKINAFYAAQDFTFVEADATNLYRLRLNDGWGTPSSYMINEFKRYTLFVKPNYLLMFDKISSANSHQYDWISHAASGGAITTEGNWIKNVPDSTNVLGINMLAPSGLSYMIGASAATNDSYPKPQVKARISADNIRYISFLYPTISSQWNNKPGAILLADTFGGSGVRILLNGTQDHIIRYVDNGELTIDQYRLTGQIASVIKDTNNNLNKIFVGNTALLKDSSGDRILVEASGNKTFEAIYSGISLALSGNDLTGLKIYAPGVNQLTVNGNQEIFSTAGDYLFIGVSDTISPAAPQNLIVN